MSSLGSVYAWCGCREPGSGRRLGARCPRRGRAGHGSWYLSLELPAKRPGQKGWSWLSTYKQRSRQPDDAIATQTTPSGDGPAYPPKAEAAEHDGQAEEDRQFVPLHEPIAAAWLIGHQLVELGGEPGGAVPGIQWTIVA